MPRAVRPKRPWRAGYWIPETRLSSAQVSELCDRAGLDHAEQEHRPRIKSMKRRVEHELSVFRAQRDNIKGAPRPVHERAALERLQAGIDDLAEAFCSLDDAVIERLGARRRQPVFEGPAGQWCEGCDTNAALEHLHRWSGIVTLALRDLEGLESRGRTPNAPRRHFVWSLANTFRDISEPDGNLAEFLYACCEIAGDPIAQREAEAYAVELLRENIP